MKIKLIKENIDGDIMRTRTAEKIYNLLMRMEPKILHPEEDNKFPNESKQWIFDDIKPKIMKILIASGYKRIYQNAIPEKINLIIVSLFSPENKPGRRGSHKTWNRETTITVATDFRIQAIKTIMKKNKSTLIHEIAHMIDFIIMGNDFYNSRAKAEAKGKEYDYWNAGIELNARWAQTISNLKDIGLISKDGDPGKFDERWIAAGKKTIIFSKIKLSKQRKFLSKLYELHSILTSEYEENEGKKWMKDMMKRMSFMDD